MEDKIRKICTETLHKEILSVLPIGKAANNAVYRVNSTAGTYIFKIYRSVWPEEEKPPLVEKLLRRHHIPHAEILHYDRHTHFPHGFLIEEYLPGTAADQASFSQEEEEALFRRLADTIFRVHQIPMQHFGYIGSIDNGAKNISQFFDDGFADITVNLRQMDLIDRNMLSSIRKKLLLHSSRLDHLSAVLCHGDLSTKNMIIAPTGDITLIDWDDAHALCWPMDIARLTLWMKTHYGAKTAARLSSVFLKAYRMPDIHLYDDCEAALHVWHGLDLMNFFAGSPYYDEIVPHVHAALGSL